MGINENHQGLPAGSMDEIVKGLQRGESMSRDLYVPFHYRASRPSVQAASCENDNHILSSQTLYLTPLCIKSKWFCAREYR